MTIENEIEILLNESVGILLTNNTAIIIVKNGVYSLIEIFKFISFWYYNNPGEFNCDYSRGT